MNVSVHTDSGERPLRIEVARRVLGRMALPALLLYLVLVGVGLLLAHPLARGFAGEDEINRDLAENRSPAWSTVTAVASGLADTPVIIATLLVLMLALRKTCRSWRESAALMSAVLLQAVVFLLTTLVVDRDRPAVPQLDIAPPTSSFPSGHTGAATALYLTLALLIFWRMRRTPLRTVVVLLLVTVPLWVGAARLYRGMHHPSDVVFGALNGIACLLISVRAFLSDARRRLPGRLGGAGRVPRPRMPGAGGDAY